MAKTPIVEVQRPVVKSPLTLYAYQKRWVQDKSRRKIAVKARRIGFSFAAGLKAVLTCLEQSAPRVIVLSRGERQSKEFITDAVAPHIRAIGAIAKYTDTPFEGGSILTHEVQFGNGTRIIALPANPETARSYEGDVILDEFAFHRDARQIYEAIAPSITRGYSIELISTPNGQQGEYFVFAKEAGLVDGAASSTRWSPHKCDIFQASAQGFRDRFGNPVDLNVLRLDCLDEEMWLQEYCCQFLSLASQWIPTDLLAACLSPDAATGEPDPAYKDLYAGWDVARKKDLSVVWLTEKVGDVSWTRGVMEMRNEPTPDQVEVARKLMKRVRRLCIDKGGMGLAIFEQLEREFGSYKVEGVDFTLHHKEALAVQAKRRMEEHRVRLPDDDTVRYSFNSIKKTVTATGQSRFDTEHDEHYGHGDHWWAFALAESAACNAMQYGWDAYLQKQAQQGPEQQEIHRCEYEVSPGRVIVLEFDPIRNLWVGPNEETYAPGTED